MPQQVEQDASCALVAPRPVIVYDGECPFCRKQVDRIRSRDVRDQFEYLPRQSASLTDRFPILAEADFNTGMRLVLPDGQVHVGADAVYQIARRLAGWRRIAWLYRVPVLHALARRIYGWIAANRQRFGQDCSDASCLVKSTDRLAGK